MQREQLTAKIWSTLPCTTPGCTKRRRMFAVSPYCESCNARLERNGDPLQKGIPYAALEHYRRRITALLSGSRIPRYKRENIRDGVKALLIEMQARCEEAEALAERYTHKPGYRGHALQDYNKAHYNGLAARLMLRVLLSKEVTEREGWQRVVAHVGALFFLRQYEPQYFVSQRAFIHQLGRGFRKITTLGDKVRVSPRNPEQLWREEGYTNPRATTIVGQTVNDTFAGLIALLMKHHERSLKTKETTSKMFEKALK